MFVVHNKKKYLMNNATFKWNALHNMCCFKYHSVLKLFFLRIERLCCCISFIVHNERHKLSTAAEMCFKMSLGRSHPKIITLWYYLFLMFFKALHKYFPNNNMNITGHISWQVNLELRGSSVAQMFLETKFKYFS